MALAKKEKLLNFDITRISPGQKVGLINLGCARNLVDAQDILDQLKSQGCEVVDIDKADIVVINTCSFVEDARKESVDVILDVIDLKRQGRIQGIIVAGCLPERYGKVLAQEFEEVDGFIGIQKLKKNKSPAKTSLTPVHHAYVKICESCFNKCSFCAIPLIKGKFCSRSIESIVKEVKALDDRGVKEINIIGQDITAYGMDIYKEKSLSRLLKRIVKITKNIEWIRLLYTYPAHITDELIETIASEEKICKYIDVPLQHINDRILKSMNRRFNKKQTLELINKIREKMADVHLRTTFVVGYPGETDKEFKELLDFISQTQFDRLGAFVYSKEESTKAFDIPKHVAKDVKKKRFNMLMKKQMAIARDLQESFVGRKLKVIIDQKQRGEKNIYLGRTEYDAPDVDGQVFVYSKKALKSGKFVRVKIKGSYEYDLTGEVA